MSADDEADYQREQCIVAQREYAASMPADAMAQSWSHATTEAATAVKLTLSQTHLLANIEDALRQGGRHTSVLRQMLAPPLSQDQFEIFCELYRKPTENSNRPVSDDAAKQIVQVFRERLDPCLAPWVSQERAPEDYEIDRVVHAIGPLLASQIYLTGRRTSTSQVQEDAVVDLLEAKGWNRLPGRSLIDRNAVLDAKQFIKKAKFATTTRPQEIDIACGLGATKVLAMECKVSNDRTNSIKRVNDVLKKATAWRDHWGSFVRPAALLQGMIGYKDVQRLTHAGVSVFWSHDLPRFDQWLDKNVS